MYIGSTTNREWVYEELWYMMATGFALLGYVGCLSVTKFRRVRREKVEFEMIKKVVKDIPKEEA